MALMGKLSTNTLALIANHLYQCVFLLSVVASSWPATPVPMASGDEAPPVTPPPSACVSTTSTCSDSSTLRANLCCSGATTISQSCFFWGCVCVCVVRSEKSTRLGGHLHSHTPMLTMTSGTRNAVMIASSTDSHAGSPYTSSRSEKGAMDEHASANETMPTTVYWKRQNLIRVRQEQTCSTSPLP